MRVAVRRRFERLGKGSAIIALLPQGIGLHGGRRGGTAHQPRAEEDQPRMHAPQLSGMIVNILQKSGGAVKNSVPSLDAP